ncbi:plasmid pRiA4b ORF-3 family protein [Ornithinimicrobium avium]|uniref:Plasmid pRiA4b ORF-3 family protein n=1 Tax=Ornithinimicrobium avium TaxID=2283195 RepID=A0A345NKF9_9MICO|nr:plasmid pRiA4b ORF-3 family protein [Ornithinimicrobium avium]AXH95517.1 plasmid pRiA4b ORF-3 family protein [Ornithinimicrobium avium]
MSDEDPIEQMRRWVAGLSGDELQTLATGILGGGLLGPAARHTPQMPELPEPPEEPCALTVRVDVDGTRPPVWRRLVLRGDLMLDEVHEVLQAAFGWEDYHLHKFWPGPSKQVWRGPSFLTQQDLDEGEEGVMESDVQLDQLLREPGDRLFYTYDFGDDWTHTIKLESVGPLDPDAPVAVCTGGRMAGPLEDCGGPYGHNELVEAYRADPALTGLDQEQRDWLPPGWDPTALDLDEVAQRLALFGMSADEVRAALSGAGAAPLPEALEPLLGLALPTVVAELAALSARARAEHEAGLTAEDLAAVARPYRYLVELAGEEGIPLTAAGWMKPSYVERAYHDLGLESDWVGRGNREDQTLPVAQLRTTCQQVGLLRKHKGRLLATRLARSLTTDEEYVAALAARLLHDRDEHLRSAKALFALLTAATGRADLDHAGAVARIMSACGLMTGPFGVEPRHASHMVWPVWFTLSQAAGGRVRGDAPGAHHHRAVALARWALWPQEHPVAMVRR